MEFEVKINNRVVTINLIRKRTIKYTYLRVLEANLVQVSANIYFTKEDTKLLIERKKAWLEKNLSKKFKNSLLKNEFYFLGQKHKNLDERSLDNFYKKESKKIIPSLVDKYSEIMQLFPTSIKYRKNRNTWGSCNYKNGLNFNILLVKFPLEVIEYIIIHELAHIKYKNHSKEFWALVYKYCPDYKKREKLLKSFL